MMPTSASVCAALLALAAHTTALSFVAPHLNALSDNSPPSYTIGTFLTIEWKTDFRDTNLILYQYLESNGTFVAKILADHYHKSHTSYIWEVAALDDSEAKDAPFHFMLSNAANPDCQGCAVNSGNFNVKQKGAGGRLPSSSISSPTSTPTPTSSNTGSAATSTSKGSTSTATQVGAGAHATQPTSSQVSSHHKSSDLGVGLGIGLGVGIPVLLAIIAGVFFCLRRRRRSQQNRDADYEQLGGPGPSQGQMRENRESGALGPWSGVHARGSGALMPYRPSFASSAWSHQSWIDPFEFERPELRDQDAMSQLRASIHSSHGMGAGGSRSLHSSRQSEWSFGMEGIPEAPQPVHQSHPENWPLP